ncbi:AMP-binding protein [Halioglobus japonicus]|uniref:AMP-binding protein n=1 Tax=Halioglobus japonicus TaxID=930805 RepID=A0AAP8MHG8_9GAMM|nr:AMP-binding protein [Halioglobus japonicus]AQA19079.1 AMP-binding protein [Halioglobus japonicus]PLW87897.1 AMP-binding protein [Halioglobus japonicus]GHD05962.1 ATP-dependent acyl-CoA ligase [Halioglobus japonicus]
MKLTLENRDDRLLGKILGTQAEHNGDTRFLVTDDVTITFAEADAQTNCLANGLRSLGIGPGDRVVLLLSNCPELVLLTLAINKLGAIWVPINTDYKGEWLADAIVGSKPALVVTDTGLAPRLADICDALGDVQYALLGDASASLLPGAVSYQSLLGHAPLQPDYSQQNCSDTCAILWTSGTTGKSKGVMQSHNNWIRAIVEGASIPYDSAPDDVIYCPLPLYNSGAWITCVYRALIEGIPCVLEQRFSVSTFWERINHFGATQVFAIGAMGSFLMNAPASADDASNTLRKAQIVPMAPQLWTAFEQRFGVELITSGLGMSECLLIMNHNNCDSDVPSYALGLPTDDLDLKLCDEEGREVAPGTPGEICIRAKQPNALFNGYFDNPQADAASFRGDWFMTGDLARFDPESGAYFFADRKKDAVRFAGRNISTLEVESVVRRHPDIADVAAFGIPAAENSNEDELKLALILKPKSKLSPEALCQFINDNAPYFFVPRYIDFATSLPYTPTQKVQKFALRQQGNSASTWDLKNSSFKVSR